MINNSNNILYPQEVTTHPLYKFIDRRGYKYEFNDLTDLCETLKDIKSSKNTYYYLTEILFQYLNTYLNNNFNKNPYYEHISYFNYFKKDEKITNILNVYKKIYNIDPKHKSFSNPFLFSILDLHEEGRNFLLQIDSKYLSNKKYTSTFIDRVLKHANDINCISKFIYDSHSNLIQLVTDDLNKYSKNIDWKIILSNNISLLNAYIAKEFNYELNQIELKQLFDSCLGLSVFKSGSDISYASNKYCEILLNSTFFKNTLAPTRDIKLSISKFISQEYRELDHDNPYKKQIFINNVITYPGYAYQNLEMKLEKQQRKEIMGKELLNKEEYAIFLEKLKEIELKKKVVKRSKI